LSATLGGCWDNPMPIGLDLLEVSGIIVAILAILEKPIAEQAKFPFVDANLNDGSLSSTGTAARNNTTNA
jgi:hypothetical protein